MILSVFKLAMFFISMAGFAFVVERSTKLQVEFIPIISISILTIILFIAGILDFLPFVTLLLFLLGIGCFVYEIIYNIKLKQLARMLQRYITPGIILYGIMLIVFLVLLKGQRLIHYDNFSHWGVIVKSMTMNNSLPNPSDAMVTFNSYPPGSALFIYYFSKIVGVSEGLALFAQMFIILSASLSLFSFSSFESLSTPIRKNTKIMKISITILTAVITLQLLKGPSTLRDLLVDTLLSAVGITLFAIIYYYFESPNRIWLPISFMGSFLLLIKNSGLFFALMAFTVYGYSLIRYYRKNERIKYNRLLLSIPFIMPIATLLTWSKYVKLVYSSDTLGKHTMGLDNYIKVFTEKNPEEIKSIVTLFAENLNNKFTQSIILILLLMLGLLVFEYLIDRKINKRIRTMFLAVVFVYIFYNIGLLGMYLFSMPTQEALYLAGYERYMSTIVHFIVGVFAIGILYCLTKQHQRYIYLIPIAFLLLIISYSNFSKDNIDETKQLFSREQIEINYSEPTIANIDLSLSHLSDNGLKSKSTSGLKLIYYPTLDQIGFTRYYLKYKLYSNNFIVMNHLNDTSKIWNYDLLTVTVVDDTIENLFSNYSTLQAEIGTFEIDLEHKEIVQKLN